MTEMTAFKPKVDVTSKFPPNYKKIIQFFNVEGREGICFAYGKKIHFPNGDMSTLSDHTIVHEMVHLKQQEELGPEKWWDKYVEDAEFRLDQEIEAFKNQLAYIKEKYGRKMFRAIRSKIINSLSSSMYGHMVTKIKAEELLR